MSPEALKELIECTVFTLVTTGIAAFCIVARRKCDNDIKEMVLDMLNNAYEFSIGEFFSLRTYQFDGLGIYGYSNCNFEGVYVIFNKTKKKCFVGSSKYVVDAISAHLEGTGDKELYRDYKKDNIFSVRMIKLKGSGFDKTKEFEKYLKNACADYCALYQAKKPR